MHYLCRELVFGQLSLMAVVTAVVLVLSTFTPVAPRKWFHRQELNISIRKTTRYRFITCASLDRVKFWFVRPGDEDVSKTLLKSLGLTYCRIISPFSSLSRLSSWRCVVFLCRSPLGLASNLLSYLVKSTSCLIHWWHLQALSRHSGLAAVFVSPRCLWERGHWQLVWLHGTTPKVDPVANIGCFMVTNFRTWVTLSWS